MFCQHARMANRAGVDSLEVAADRRKGDDFFKYAKTGLDLAQAHQRAGLVLALEKLGVDARLER